MGWLDDFLSVQVRRVGAIVARLGGPTGAGVNLSSAFSAVYNPATGDVDVDVIGGGGVGVSGTASTSTGVQVPTTVMQVPAPDNAGTSMRLTLKGWSLTGSGAAYGAEYVIHVGVVSGVLAAQMITRLSLLDTGRLTAQGGVANCANNGSGFIRVTTDATHNLTTGMAVVIQGVTGTTEANGTWTITKIDSVTFDLQGSTFVHAFVALGAWARGGGFLGISWSAGQLSIAVQGVGEMPIDWSARAQVF